MLAVCTAYQIRAAAVWLMYFQPRSGPEINRFILPEARRPGHITNRERMATFR